MRNNSMNKISKKVSALVLISAFALMPVSAAVDTGLGTSVVEAVKAFEKACGHEINHVFGPRRPGDIAVCYASTKKAEEVLGFKAKYGIEEMCSSCWKWQTMNPNGLQD